MARASEAIDLWGDGLYIPELREGLNEALALDWLEGPGTLRAKLTEGPSEVVVRAQVIP
jgi:hypothetical protein